MADVNKDDAVRSTNPVPPRSGSDAASAANISAGTSVGNAGQPATPYGQPATGAPIGQTAGSPDWARGGAGDAPRRAGEPARTADTVGRPASATAGSAAGGLREQAEHAAEQASDWTREQYRQGARQLNQAREHSARQLRSAQTGIERFATENPLMVGVMGLAAGLVIGALLPRTRHEDRAFGRWSDEVRDQGMRYARDATQRGREYVEDALGGDADDEEWRPDDERRGGIRSSGPRYQNH
jgi:ElaB/YqjD/DUF883 family membrane-anchored ribosome-binding protein